MIERKFDLREFGQFLRRLAATTKLNTFAGYLDVMADRIEATVIEGGVDLPEGVSKDVEMEKYYNRRTTVI